MKQPVALVVDDSPELRLLMSSLCRNLGLEVVAVRDGGAALTAAAERRPDVVCLDLMLPTLSGLEVCERLKSHALGKLFWNGTDDRGILTIPVTDITLPGNNQMSTVYFTFEESVYGDPKRDETVIITFSSLGCENVTITSTLPAPTPPPAP